MNIWKPKEENDKLNCHFHELDLQSFARFE